MKPTQSILDDAFHYVPAMATSVSATWSRFGWRPTTPEERGLRRMLRPQALQLQLKLEPGEAACGTQQRNN